MLLSLLNIAVCVCARARAMSTKRHTEERGCTAGCERERDLGDVNSVFSHDDVAFVRFGAEHFAHKRRPRECMREFQVCIQLPFKEPVLVYRDLSFMLFSIVSGVDCACLK